MSRSPLRGLVLPGILGSGSGNWLMRLTPTAAYTAVALGAATWLLRRPDASAAHVATGQGWCGGA